VSHSLQSVSEAQPTGSYSDQGAIVQTLWYFKYFDHALSVEELHGYLPVHQSIEQVERACKEGVEQGVLLFENGFYALDHRSLQRRTSLIEHNRRWMRIGRRMGRFIGRFPFVRSVMISGALSKMGLNGEDDDIDFFLIAAPGRVWTAKFFLMLFKKLFLLNSKRYFCINLLRDQGHLGFSSQDRYTATELISLQPVVGGAWHVELMRQNNWVAAVFPNAALPEEQASELSPELRWTERFLDRFLGVGFERWCRARFARHVARQKDQPNAHFETDAHASAYFPNSFKERILTHFHSRNFS
jgi:hypothetical protein